MASVAIISQCRKTPFGLKRTFYNWKFQRENKKGSLRRYVLPEEFQKKRFTVRRKSTGGRTNCTFLFGRWYKKWTQFLSREHSLAAVSTLETLDHRLDQRGLSLSQKKLTVGHFFQNAQTKIWWELYWLGTIEWNSDWVGRSHPINKPGTAQVGAISKSQQIMWTFGEKIDNVIREKKTLHPNF